MPTKRARRRKQLNQDDRRSIRSRRRQHVEKTLAGLKPNIARSKWVGIGNRYASDTIAKIRFDAKSQTIRNPRHLSQYIAASCLLHCVDGWSYLGKAILSLLRGDPHRARHLAYYAELRAAMSLLATEGVGVFDNKHFIIDAPNSVAKLRGGDVARTHQFAWACLQYWSTLPESSSLFAKIVRPYGRNLDDWFVPFGGIPTIAPQASSWFRRWGVDLRAFPEDHDARNVSSYRPDGIPKFWRTDGHGTLNFVRELWSAFEPSPSSRFESIDREILRIAMENVFKGKTGNSAATDPSGYLAFATQAVDNQGLGVDMRQQWLDFITRKIAPSSQSMFLYAGMSPRVLDRSELAIVSRAALLLRIASGSTSLLFDASAFTLESLAFWWKDLGLGRGLWKDSQSSDELLDLWADIGSALGDVEAFQLKHTPDAQTFFQIGEELGRPLIGLTECERVALWSLSI
jgi:hypothetical protein